MIEIGITGLRDEVARFADKLDSIVRVHERLAPYPNGGSEYVRLALEVSLERPWWVEMGGTRAWRDFGPVTPTKVPLTKTPLGRTMPEQGAAAYKQRSGR